MSKVFKCGGSVHGQKSYGCEPCAKPCEPCKPCKPKPVVKKVKCCDSCTDPCDPCYRPYVVACNQGGECTTYDLCITPDPCLMKDPEFKNLYCELKESILYHRIDLLLRDLNSSTYDSLVLLAQTVAGRVDNGRIVITLPDGTVVVDTNGSNSWANYQSKSINENHNSRIAILNSQLCLGGVGYEQKYSTSTGNVEKYVAIRLGEYLKNFGSIRISIPVTLI